MRNALPLAAALAAAVSLQDAATAQTPSPRLDRPDAALSAFAQPLHSEQDPRNTVEEIWAAGATFKASFHAGFAFVPVLGAGAPRNLPWRFTTTGIGRSAATPPRRVPEAHAPHGHIAGAWRYEYALETEAGTIVEAYDVRDDGVEQSFVIPHAPAGTGDLRIVGRVDSPLACPPRDARHAPLVFRDRTSRAVVEYGTAIAFDAAGRRTPVTTSFDGTRIELAVPEAFVQDASFPVVVDPLVGSVWLDNGGSSQDVVAADSIYVPTSDRAVVALVRAVSAADTDLTIVEWLPNFTNPTTVLSDSGVTRSFDEVDLTTVGSRWVAVFGAELVGDPIPHRIGWHARLATDSSFQSAWTILAHSFLTSRRHPVVGGRPSSAAANTVVILSEQESGVGNPNTTATAVRSDLLDVATGSVLHTEFLGGSAFDAERPSVCETVLEAADAWVFAYQANQNTGQGWEVRLARVRADGTIDAASTPIGAAGNPGLWNAEPRLDGGGRNGRMSFLCTYLRTLNIGVGAPERGNTVRATRFEWNRNAAEPTIVREFDLRDESFSVANVGVAFDTVTCGHWATVTRQEPSFFGAQTTTVQRHDADTILETGDIADTGLTAGLAVSFDSDDHDFPVVYTSDGSRPRVAFLQHPFVFPPFSFGPGCGSRTLETFGPSLAGNRHFAVHQSGTATPSALFVSLDPAADPLDALGFPGCFLLADLDPAFLLAAIPTTGGTLTLSLANDFTAFVYFQAAYVDASRPNGLGFTNAVEVEIVR